MANNSLGPNGLTLGGFPVNQFKQPVLGQILTGGGKPGKSISSWTAVITTPEDYYLPSVSSGEVGYAALVFGGLSMDYTTEYYEEQDQHGWPIEMQRLDYRIANKGGHNVNIRLPKDGGSYFVNIEIESKVWKNFLDENLGYWANTGKVPTNLINATSKNCPSVSSEDSKGAPLSPLAAGTIINSSKVGPNWDRINFLYGASDSKLTLYSKAAWISYWRV